MFLADVGTAAWLTNIHCMQTLKKQHVQLVLGTKDADKGCLVRLPFVKKIVSK